MQLKPGAHATADEIREFARIHIPERAAAPVDVAILDALPLTSIGKIYKPPLRHDAARRAFEAALGARGIAARVSVGDDAVSGTRDSVILSAAERAGEARAILGAFTIPCDISSA